MTTLSELRRSSLDELERLYREAPVGPIPLGRFGGHWLLRVESRLAKTARAALIALPFERAPFGIDFESRTWFFFRTWMRMGRFRMEQRRSRWRDAEVLRLEYDVSRLPSPIRGLLYDEVKPLSESLCLGLGGINAGLGDGDRFFFALERPRD